MSISHVQFRDASHTVKSMLTISLKKIYPFNRNAIIITGSRHESRFVNAYSLTVLINDIVKPRAVPRDEVLRRNRISLHGAAPPVR